MITKTKIVNDLIYSLQYAIENDVNGDYLVDGEKIIVADNLYPDAQVEDIGTNNYPAIIMRVGNTIDVTSHGGNSYTETFTLEAYCYVETGGNVDTSRKLDIVEQMILDRISTVPQFPFHEAVFSYSGVSRGFVSSGAPDLYTQGYFENLAISVLSIEVSYKTKCN